MYVYYILSIQLLQKEPYICSSNNVSQKSIHDVRSRNFTRGLYNQKLTCKKDVIEESCPSDLLAGVAWKRLLNEAICNLGLAFLWKILEIRKRYGHFGTRKFMKEKKLASWVIGQNSMRWESRRLLPFSLKGQRKGINFPSLSSRTESSGAWLA